MRDEAAVRARIETLEDAYDAHDPPASPTEDASEVAILRAIEELEWVLGERSSDDAFTQ